MGTENERRAPIDPAAGGAEARSAGSDGRGTADDGAGEKGACGSYASGLEAGRVHPSGAAAGASEAAGADRIGAGAAAAGTGDGRLDGGADRPTASAEEIAFEAVRYRRLQRAVDVSLALIQQIHDLTLGETIEIVLHTRGIATELFPGSEATFDLLYRPRLMRAIRERFGIDAEVD